MYTVNSIMNKTNTTNGWYYGNDTVKQTIKKNTNNEFPNSPQHDGNFNFLSTVNSQAPNNEYGTFIEKNSSVIVKNNSSNDNDNSTTKKKSDKDNIDELVEKSKLMNISNTYKKNQVNNNKVVEVKDNDKSYMKECEDDFPTIRKRPVNAQPDIEILNSIETVYEMVYIYIYIYIYINLNYLY